MNFVTFPVNTKSITHDTQYTIWTNTLNVLEKHFNKYMFMPVLSANVGVGGMKTLWILLPVKGYQNNYLPKSFVFCLWSESSMYAIQWYKLLKQQNTKVSINVVMLHKIVLFFFLLKRCIAEDSKNGCFQRH